MLRYAFMLPTPASNTMLRLVPRDAGPSFTAQDVGAACLDDDGAVAALVEYPTSSNCQSRWSVAMAPWIESAIAGAWTHQESAAPLSERGTTTFPSADTRDGLLRPRRERAPRLLRDVGPPRP